MSRFLNARSRAFLDESNGLAGLPITYRDQAVTPGGHSQLEAFAESQGKAKKQVAVTVGDLERWHQWLMSEQSDVASGTAEPLGAPEVNAIGDWLQDLDQCVRDVTEADAEDDVVAALLGDQLTRFCHLWPYPQSVGRLERLLANYLATRFGRALFVFRADEKATVEGAHVDPLALRTYYADKLREALLMPDGQIAERIRTLGATDEYQQVDGEKFLVEWHGLIAAVQGWQATSA